VDVPNRKRDATRQRLLAAANRRFREQGYELTTAAAIAADAGVTERTFFRYFPTKADVLIANWQGHADALRHALATSTRARLADVVRDALVAFTDRLQAELDAGLDSVMRLYTDRTASGPMALTLLRVEHDIARELARRTGLRIDDFDVRVAANASFGVFRASVRAFVSRRDSPPISQLIGEGMARLRPCFAVLHPLPTADQRRGHEAG
jgi:AcrR family transcriptional regulator